MKEVEGVLDNIQHYKYNNTTLKYEPITITEAMELLSNGISIFVVDYYPIIDTFFFDEEGIPFEIEINIPLKDLMYQKISLINFLIETVDDQQGYVLAKDIDINSWEKTTVLDEKDEIIGYTFSYSGKITSSELFKIPSLTTTSPFTLSCNNQKLKMKAEIKTETGIKTEFYNTCFLFYPDFDLDQISVSSSSGNGTVKSTVTIPYKTQYNIRGSFNFYASEEKIKFADFFFKGIGFYYNFDAGITQNKRYTNKPYWFYLHFMNDFITKDEKNLLEETFYSRNPIMGLENSEEKIKTKANGNCSLSNQNIQYSIINNTIEIVFSGNPILINENGDDSWGSFFYREKVEDGIISLYTEETFTYLLYNSNVIAQNKQRIERNQTLEDTNTYFNLDFYYTPMPPFVNYDDKSIALLNKQYRENFILSLKKQYNFNFSTITSNLSIKFSDGKRKIELYPEEIDKNNILKQSTINLSLEESEYSSLEDIYSFELSFVESNFKEEIRISRTCYWIPFNNTFSVKPQFYNYKPPQWIQKTFSPADVNRIGLFRIPDVGIRRYLYDGIQEYEECVHSDNPDAPAPYYDSENQIFYENYPVIPFECSIHLHSLFTENLQESESPYTQLLTILGENNSMIYPNIDNQKLILFPQISSTIYYQFQYGAPTEDWNKIQGVVFSPSGVSGSSFDLYNLQYSYRTVKNNKDKYLILSTNLTSPLANKNFQTILTNVPMGKKLFFKTEGAGEKIEWSYSPLNAAPTITYRKQRIGINSSKIDEDINLLLTIDQTNNESKYITFYNQDGDITLQIDIQTGNFYLKGEIKDSVMYLPTQSAI